MAIPFAVYLKGLAPSVVLCDTGDFQTAGWIWGVAHPPGYPLYTILVGTMERLPIPPMWIQTAESSLPAWRSNLLSALIALAALAALFALVNRLTGRPWVGMVASGALAFSRVFWWHAEIAENDALTCLLLVLLLLLAVRWAQEKRKGDAYLLALTFGLAASHHQSLLLFAPAVLVYLFLRRALSFAPKQSIALVLMFLLGLAPFVYLPLTGYRTPDGRVRFVNDDEYGTLPHPGGLSDKPERYSKQPPLEYFLDYIGRTAYTRTRVYTHSEEALGEDKTTTSDVIGFYTGTLLEDFTPVFVAVGLIGLVAGWKTRRPKRVTADESEDSRFARDGWILLLVAYGVYFLVLHFYPSGDILRAPRYALETAGPGLMLPLEVCWAALVGLGFGAVLQYRVPQTLEKPRQMSSRTTGCVPYRVPYRVSQTLVCAELALLVVGIAAIVWIAVRNHPYTDKSHNTLAHEYGLNALDSCPLNSILVTAGDEIHVFWYLANVHPDPLTGESGYRRDAAITNWAGELGGLRELEDPGGAMASAISRLIREKAKREIDATFFHSRFLDAPGLSGRTLARRGILFAFVPPGFEEGLEPVHEDLVESTGLKAFQPGLPDTYRWDFWGGNAIAHDIPMNGQERPLWAPEEDIQWRIGEMLLFYALAAALDLESEKERRYFRQLALVEPQNETAAAYFALSPLIPY